MGPGLCEGGAGQPSGPTKTDQDADPTLHEAEQIEAHRNVQDDAISTLLDQRIKLERPGAAKDELAARRNGTRRGQPTKRIPRPPARRPRKRTGWSYTAGQEVTMDFLAITLLGFKFSGTLALGVVVVIVVGIGLVWFVTSRQRRR
jgi:hypothetical protein